MGNISLREAVKIFDVSRPTLLKSLKNGKLSGVKDGKGRWELDPSELSRIYQPRRSDEDSLSTAKGGKNLSPFNSLEGDLNERIRQLENELVVEKAAKEAMEVLAAERGRHIEDLRKLLPVPTPVDTAQAEPGRTQKKRSWWPW